MPQPSHEKPRALDQAPEFGAAWGSPLQAFAPVEHLDAPSAEAPELEPSPDQTPVEAPTGDT